MTHSFIHPLTDFDALGAALLLAYSVLAISTLLDPILEMADYFASRISHFLTTSPTQEKPHVPLSEKNN
jgi:hypothetical protein